MAFAGSKEINIREFWAWPFDYSTMCRKFWEVFCKGIIQTFFSNTSSATGKQFLFYGLCHFLEIIILEIDNLSHKAEQQQCHHIGALNQKLSHRISVLCSLWRVFDEEILSDKMFLNLGDLCPPLILIITSSLIVFTTEISPFQGSFVHSFLLSLGVIRLSLITYTWCLEQNSRASYSCIYPKIFDNWNF